MSDEQRYGPFPPPPVPKAIGEIMRRHSAREAAIEARISELNEARRQREAELLAEVRALREVFAPDPPAQGTALATKGARRASGRYAWAVLQLARENVTPTDEAVAEKLQKSARTIGRLRQRKLIP